MTDEEFKKSVFNCILKNVSLEEINSIISLECNSYKECEKKLSNLYDELDLKEFAEKFYVITDDDILYDVILKKCE